MLLQRQGIDRLGVGLVAIAVQPLDQLAVAGDVRGGAIALRQHFAEQQPVVETRDLAVGFLPMPGLLQCEDVAVARDVRGGQHRGKIGFA